LTGDVARWFMPGGFGHESGLEPAPLPVRAFLTRALNGVDRTDGGEWARENQLTPRLDFSHNLSRVFPPALFDTHPEYFPEEAGQRLRPPVGSGWWNPDLGREDVARHAAEMARKFFTDKPHAASFALGVNDGLIFGESPELLALTTPVRWFRERPDYSNLVFTFMNRSATDLAKSHPDKYLGALAYYWAENAPDFPVHPRVIPFLTADRAQGYDAAFRTEEKCLQQRWASSFAKASADSSRRGVSGEEAAAQRAGAALPSNLKAETGNLKESDSGFRSQVSGLKLRLGLYDYLYGHGFLIPRFHPHLIADNLRQARRLGFTDYFAEMTPNWGLDGPQPWLVAQLLQDPEQSADKLLAEYYRRYFKESAFQMQRFFQRCEEQWMNQPGPAYWLKHYRNESQATIFPSAVCAELRILLEQAEQHAQSDLVRKRVRQIGDAFGVTERFVAIQEARDRVSRLALSAGADSVALLTVLQRFQKARTDFVAYTRKLQTEQSLLIAPFIMDDYLRNDPTANALAAMEDPASLMRASQGAAEGRELAELAASIAAVQRDGRELAINGGLAGALKPERQSAGLTYSVALPEPWQSRVEPVQWHRVAWSGDAARVLKISGTKDTAVFQWCALDGVTFALAQAEMRGRVSSSGVAMLTIGWLDSQQRHLGTTVIRLPEGEWHGWQTLRQAAKAPAGAVWVGVGIRIQHQLKDDWVEVKEFSLRAAR
jgi:hypothetical protein